MTGQDNVQREIECLVKNAVEKNEITQSQADKILERAEDEDWLSELWQEIDEKIEERIQEAGDEIKYDEEEEEQNRKLKEEAEKVKPEKVVFT